MVKQMFSIKRFVRLTASLALLAASMLVSPHRQVRADEPLVPAASGLAKVEAMLKQLNMVYQRIENPGQPPCLRVVVQDPDGQASIVTLRVAPQRFNYSDGSNVEYVYCFTQVRGAEPNKPVSMAIAQKVAELADNQMLGNCSVNASGVFVNMGFVLRGVDVEGLQIYIYSSHYAALNARKLLTPLFAAELAGG